jgi:O-antigen biosynthesis protein
MAPLPKVSLCVPTFNGTKFLPETLESIEQQDYPNLEIIFCDDCSTDQTVAIVNEFINTQPVASCRVIESNIRQGLPSNWNFCIKESTGDYIKFLFQDDCLNPDCISKMVKQLNAHSNVGIAFCKRDIINHLKPKSSEGYLSQIKNVHLGWTNLSGIQSGQELLRDARLWETPLNKIGEPTAVLISRKAIDRIGHFDTQFSQLADLDLWLRILQYFDVIFVDEVLCKFRIHDLQQSQVNIFDQDNEVERFQLLQKIISGNEYETLSTEVRRVAGLTLNQAISQELHSRAELEKHNVNLTKEISSKIDNIDNIEKELAKKSGHIVEINEDIQRKENHINELQAELVNRNNQVSELSVELHQLWEEKNTWLDRYKKAHAALKGFQSTWYWKARTMLSAMLGEDSKSLEENASRKSIVTRCSTKQVEVCTAENEKVSMEEPARLLLEQFLAEDRKLAFPVSSSPRVSIILVLYNRADLTLQCLQSLVAQPFKNFEIIIIDNESTDETPKLFNRFTGNVRVVVNNENKGFLHACNQGAKYAIGQYLLFLNNDTIVIGNSIGLGVQTLDKEKDAGAVGGRLVLPGGRLQEAGSFIDRNGSCHGYGRNAFPSSFEFMFQRDVDYCSGAFLMTPRSLHCSLQGFDSNYQPAYFEEVDYCVRVWKAGYRVIYDPRISILHHEFASSANRADAIKLQKTNRQKFVVTHKDWLAGKLAFSGTNSIAHRHREIPKLKILFLEDKIPHQHLGSGFTRSHCMLLRLLDLGVFVTIYPTNYPDEPWDEVYSDIPRTVEVATGLGRENLKRFLTERASYYDIILASRPHNLEAVRKIQKGKPSVLANTKLIYDAEALYCLRDFTEAALKGRPITPERQRIQIQDEIELTEDCDAVISVSALETRKFREHGVKNIHTIGFCIGNNLGSASFSERQDILFVGSVHLMKSPNADSIQWFSKEVFPRIQQSLQASCKFLIAGTNLVPELKIKVAALDNPDIKFMGELPDLAPLYNQARIFVAPTRYAAGIPQKVCEAAASGIPVVSTSLIAQQLDWTAGEDLLVADSANALAEECVRLYTDSALWERIRANSASKVIKDCSPEVFDARLAGLLESVGYIQATS